MAADLVGRPSAAEGHRRRPRSWCSWPWPTTAMLRRAVCDPGIATLAAETGIGRRWVFRIVNGLAARGLLIRHSGAGRGHS